jgi:hypothetical protein
MTWTMRVVIAVSLVAASLVSGSVGFLLAPKFYVFEEMFIGLLWLAVLFAAGVVVVLVLVFLRELWLRILKRDALDYPD